MEIKLNDALTIVIPDDANEYVQLVDLHDQLKIHEHTGPWPSVCKTCGCYLGSVYGYPSSILTGDIGVVRHALTEKQNGMLRAEAIKRSPHVAYAYVAAYGNAPDLRDVMLASIDDESMKAKLAQYASQFMEIGQEAETVLDKCASRYHWKQYYSKVKGESDDRVANIKGERRLILARNKEIWETLTGKYGSERQRMIDELETGIETRKRLKIEENRLNGHKRQIRSKC
jgi:hypothetical protein